MPVNLQAASLQRPEEKSLLVQIESVGEAGKAGWIDANILKPLYDDVQAARFAAEAVDVVEGQFPERPDLFRAVKDCATVLGMPAPKVYVTGRMDRAAIVVGLAEPKIIISSRVLRLAKSDAELRFIIGRQMGHVRSGHVRWLVVVRGVTDLASRMVALPDLIALSPFVPFLRWAREAEMTADAWGLVCAQDLAAAEQAMVGSELDFADRVDVDLFLLQRQNQDLSQFAEIVSLANQITRREPFLAERIRQLRTFAQSPQYRDLWR